MSKLKAISRRFPACTRTREDEINVQEKIRNGRNVRGKTEGKRSNKFLYFLMIYDLAS